MFLVVATSISTQMYNIIYYSIDAKLPIMSYKYYKWTDEGIIQNNCVGTFGVAFDI